MAFFDDLRQRWERLAERERRLLEILGLTLIVFIFVAVGFFIQRGLSNIESRNDDVRTALDLLRDHRDEYLQQRGKQANSAVAMIGDTAPPLATYLESIAKEAGVQISESSDGPREDKGRFEEVTENIKLGREGVSIQDLSQFLKLIETKSPIVVTKDLHVRPFFNQHDKLSVELTVATYQKRKKNAKGGKKTRSSGTQGSGK